MKTGPLLGRALLAGLLALGVAACDNTNPGDLTPLTLKLTDAPGDIHAAVVTISKITLHGGGDDVVLLDNPVTTDLTDLANATQTLVAGVEVPSGTYSEMRFEITGGYVEVENDDGSTSIFASSDTYEGLPVGAIVAGPLELPSFGSSGLKVKFEGDHLELQGTAKVVLLDFDVAQSFGHASGVPGWVLHPVITGADIEASASQKVTIRLGEGVVLPTINGTPMTLGDVSAVLTNSGGSDETVPFTDANTDGTFEADFLFLLPGNYTLTLTGPAGVTYTTSPAIPLAVSVSSGGSGTTDLVLTGTTGP